jgi:hypothetical protein
MKRLAFGTATVLMITVAGAAFSLAGAQQGATAAPNNMPLSFGMDAQAASQALGTTLNYLSGRPGNELYLALPNVNGAALSERKDGLYLQFRRGRLEGWKGDWGTNRPCCN